MIGAMPYRGPDQTGFHRDDHIAVGHSRLTIIDPVGGRQPRHDPPSDDLLVFNGEIYGYRYLAEELRQQGEALRDQSDTEVLFALIRRHGVLGAIARIDGMFAFVFREGRTGRLWLARDRFGEKPLHYAHGPAGLAFASEVKALLQHPHWRNATLDHGALGRFLFFDYLPGGDTGLADLRKLPAGHALEYNGSKIRLHRYWQPVIGASGAQAAPSRPEAVEQLDQLLNQSIRDRLVADVPVGVFLSGGIDSSLVAALAGRIAPGIT
ncbi:MAG: asparagine synthetase B, partial [Alphaproteobacteria bacterium]|nr:asparagine synthetase B [Alphaproteobacteria bacterium]